MPAPAKRTVVTVAIAAIVMAAGMDTYTYAATGDSLILGKLNKSNRTTHVTSTGDGPALSLHAAGTRPALAVDSSAKIVRLNADTVDGQDAAGLQNNVRVLTTNSLDVPEGTVELDLAGLPEGRYLATFDVYMQGSAGNASNPTTAGCYFHQADTQTYSGHTTGTSVRYPIGITGASVIDTKGGDWTLRCYATDAAGGPNDWWIVQDTPLRVTMTRIDRSIGGQLSVAETRTP